MLSDALCAGCDDFKTAKTVSVLSLQYFSQLCRLFLFKRVTDKTLHSMVLMVISYLLFFHLCVSDVFCTSLNLCKLLYTLVHVYLNLPLRQMGKIVIAKQKLLRRLKYGANSYRVSSNPYGGIQARA